jgi:hypothetical protein
LPPSIDKSAAWHADGVELLTVPRAAQALGVDVRRVQQYIRDGHLVAVRDDSGATCVPDLFIADSAVVKHLPAVITLLRDARFDDTEIIDWLLRVDASLPGSPIEALRANRSAEVKRRAQVAGY